MLCVFLAFGIICPSLVKERCFGPEHAKFDANSSSFLFIFQEKEKRFYYSETSVKLWTNAGRVIIRLNSDK